MRIAFVQHHSSPHVIKRALYLHSKGHELFYFGFCKENENLNLPNEIKCFRIEDNTIKGKLHTLNIIKRIMISTISITKLSRKNKIDIIIPMGLGYLPLCLFSKSIIVLEHMGSDVLISANKTFIHQLFTRFLYIFCKGVIQDSFIAKEAGLNLGAPIKNNIVAEVGVQTNYFNLNLPKNEIRHRYNLQKESIIIFSPRGYSDIYNIQTIFKSIPLIRKKYSNCYFVFIQSFQQLKPEDQKFIMENELFDYCIFTGFLKNTSELPLFYKDANLSVSIPSSDSSPLSVFEGIACGCTFITTNLPWIDKKLIKGKHIHTIDSPTPKQLANKICECIENKDYFNVNQLYEHIEINCNYEKENEKVNQLLNEIFRMHRL